MQVTDRTLFYAQDAESKKVEQGWKRMTSWGEVGGVPGSSILLSLKGNVMGFRFYPE